MVRFILRALVAAIGFWVAAHIVPGVHVNYAETVLPMRDGLPKLKDFPAEFGGSGEMLPE